MDSLSVKNRIVGWGSQLPKRVMTNHEFKEDLNTSDEWIVKRTGIRQRFIADPNDTEESCAALASSAGLKALHQAQISPDDLELIVVATSTPDSVFPSMASTVQRNIGHRNNCPCFDMQAACTGFVYALQVVDAMMKVNGYRHALLIGAEVFSRILDWDDRSTCVLFGDGAGAIVLKRNDDVDEPRGIIRSIIRADGKQQECLYVDGGISSKVPAGVVRMNGREVYKLAVGMVPSVVTDLLKETNTDIEDIDWFVPHQANLRIIDATAEKLGLPLENVVRTAQNHANTSAASIPLALDSAASSGAFKPNDLILLEAMGGGFTWGSALIQW